MTRIQTLLDKGMNPLIINRIVSMDKKMIEECCEINELMHKVDDDMIIMLMKLRFDNKFKYEPYIKSLKDNDYKEDNLLLAIKNYYGWSKKDCEEQKKIFVELFKNEKELDSYETFFGIETKE